MARFALILDFDGVIADSEPLANQTLADLLTELGATTTLEQSYARYVGRRISEIAVAVAAHHRIALPEDFERMLLEATIARFQAELEPVPGVRDFLARHAETPKAIASSSPVRRLKASIETLGLGDAFGEHVYSADMVRRGKPAPDLFLMAAAAIDARPAKCVVVEDSPSGVEAGVAAGMRTIGLLAGGHILPGHEARLRDAGAWRVVDDFSGVAAALAEL